MNKLIIFFLAAVLHSSEFVTIATKNNQEKILSAPYVVIDVYATWCGPCKKFGPIFNEVAGEMGSKYLFVKADVDGDSGIADIYSVTRYPTVLFFKNGREVGRQSGCLSKETLKSKILNSFSE